MNFRVHLLNDCVCVPIIIIMTIMKNWQWQRPKFWCVCVWKTKAINWKKKVWMWKHVCSSSSSSSMNKQSLRFFFLLLLKKFINIIHTPVCVCVCIDWMWIYVSNYLIPGCVCQFIGHMYTHTQVFFVFSFFYFISFFVFQKKIK